MVYYACVYVRMYALVMHEDAVVKGTLDLSLQPCVCVCVYYVFTCAYVEKHSGSEPAAVCVHVCMLCISVCMYILVMHTL